MCYNYNQQVYLIQSVPEGSKAITTQNQPLLPTHSSSKCHNLMMMITFASHKSSLKKGRCFFLPLARSFSGFELNPDLIMPCN